MAMAPKGLSRQRAGLEARFRGLNEAGGKAAKRPAIHPDTLSAGVAIVAIVA
jgi:hypothetical protein